MHLQNGANTSCSDVAPAAEAGCSDLNTTVFLDAVLKLERPDLVVFSGDNTHAANSVTWAIDLFTKVCKDNNVPLAPEWEGLRGRATESARPRRGHSRISPAE